MCYQTDVFRLATSAVSARHILGGQGKKRERGKEAEGYGVTIRPASIQIGSSTVLQQDESSDNNHGMLSLSTQILRA